MVLLKLYFFIVLIFNLFIYPFVFETILLTYCYGHGASAVAITDCF